MNIAHVIIEKAVTNFLGNQPIVKLVDKLFRNGRQVSDEFEPIKHISYMVFNEGVGTMRMHWNDVVPNLLKDIEKTVDLDTEFTIQVKGLTAEIVVKYDTSSMWFNITSETFDKLFALAVERSKE